MELLPDEKQVLTEAGVLQLTTRRLAVGAEDSNWSCAWLQDIVLVHLEYFSQRRLLVWSVVCGVAVLLLGGVSGLSALGRQVVQGLRTGLIVLAGGLFLGWLLSRKTLLRFHTAAGSLTVMVKGGWREAQDLASAYALARYTAEKRAAPPALTAPLSMRFRAPLDYDG